MSVAGEDGGPVCIASGGGESCTQQAVFASYLAYCVPTGNVLLDFICGGRFIFVYVCALARACPRRGGDYGGRFLLYL